MPGPSIRDGKPADLAALTAIETASFASDRLSQRSFRRLIGSASARLRIAAAGGAVLGYHLVLTRRNSRIARLYSIVVAAPARGSGIGERLLADAERTARKMGARSLRLEVRADNAAAIRLYERRGYIRIGAHRHYYADGADAIRYEKRLPGSRHGAAAGMAGDDEDRSPAAFGVTVGLMTLSSCGVANTPACVAPFLAPGGMRAVGPTIGTGEA